MADELCEGEVSRHSEGMGAARVYRSVVWSRSTAVWEDRRSHTWSKENLHAGMDTKQELLTACQ